MGNSVYAHTLENNPDPEHWQELPRHLHGVAERAAHLAESFSSSDWGYLAGLWHDLGKYQVEFQEKLLGGKVSVEHSGAGAALAVKQDHEQGIPLAFVIAGHHAGLANLLASAPALPTPLQERLRDNESLLSRILRDIPTEITQQTLPALPEFLRSGPETRNRRGQEAQRRRFEFWIRFFFSVLVDADRLDTERFSDPDRTAKRGRYGSITLLRERLDTHIGQKVGALSAELRTAPVNLARSSVLSACRRAASQGPGFFALTVPTGGGKTLSSMSFALNHAECHGLRRVIAVIPYTSIIEQNAEVYREALGTHEVVEHHSNLDPVRIASEHGQEVTDRWQLACENWDAPIIVTTSVQFFETLFSNHPSRCRKLHNVARSVIILDEVQTLPPQFLLSIIDGLNELVAHYGCSVVLSTATPPALVARDGFPGLKGIREIIPYPEQLARDLKRVEYVWPVAGTAPVEWPALAAELAGHPQVLAVVHRRDDARTLAQEIVELVPDEPVFHLSALMCPAHRSEILARTRESLRCGGPCRVVSTQLVEAGVDLDFPIVYRALGGLDSIVQAGGRCNREGRQASGRVVIFRAPTSPPFGTPRKGLEIAESILCQSGGQLDPNGPDIFRTYFRMLYFTEDLDAKQIQTHRQGFNFATVDREFRLIEDGCAQSVIVPYGQARERLEDVRRNGPTRDGFRALQPFIVNVYPNAFHKLLRAGALEEVAEGVFAVGGGYEGLYSDAFGLVCGDIHADPSAFVV